MLHDKSTVTDTGLYIIPRSYYSFPSTDDVGNDMTAVKGGYCRSVITGAPISLYQTNLNIAVCVNVHWKLIAPVSLRDEETTVIRFTGEIRAKKPSLTLNLGTNGLKVIQTTANGRAGGLLARTGSLGGHPSKQQPRSTLLDPVISR
ncbi:hypothetical protein J6590_100219 [Homalodisca vitripennis]|nr:hypothetical protein J6590_100219 [Homalodisca vitripennis]